MSSYQIPQFLDSGDKILGPLNLRQFAYALGGFFVSLLVYTTTQTLVPNIGTYAIIPAIPFAGLTAYLALGRYNGRDSEIYVLKFFLYFAKPRQMMYIRAPDTTDLDEQLAALSYDKILQEWNGRLSKIKQLESSQLAGFTEMTPQDRARRIRSLGTQLDMGFYNSLRTMHQGEITLQKNQALLNSLSANKSKSAFPLNSATFPSFRNKNNTTQLESTSKPNSNDTNFFDKGNV